MTALPENPTWLIRIASAPIFSGRSVQGIDAVLACGAFGQSVAVVLEGEGLGLLSEQLKANDGERNLHRQLASLPLYDIDAVFAVVDEPIDNPQPRTELLPALEDLTISPITRGELAILINHATHTLSF